MGGGMVLSMQRRTFLTSLLASGLVPAALVPTATSILERVTRTLIYRERLREASAATATRHLTFYSPELSTDFLSLPDLNLAVEREHLRYFYLRGA